MWESQILGLFFALFYNLTNYCETFGLFLTLFHISYLQIVHKKV